ncbi:hypothetical protein ACV6RK_000866 [Cronobacter malonaticus]|uniref:Uncharacterized protein n=1 Tax=Cronobacter malonaticus TaxID=413503 RepID=A0A423XTD4_9ENTR|nr:hypothetical protein [Cronobacter malonaticus]ELY5940268.1 hypothetical protein [Cronobacter malonaticus]ELY6205555.1 hypothetical protein [Cronobacter malonaticus]ELY6259641.1 hypothetical protein [Cronobacter malonaticus]MDT3559284.1 hypothetical protein [Cronobacter malonaticus]ROW59781.1 hypothetical protein C3E80_15465 [Cronobacter malonaticus]
MAWLRKYKLSMATLARRAAKTLLFLALFCVFARVIDASRFISQETANAFAAWLHGSANQENHDELWFFADITLSLLCAAVTTRLVILSCRKARGICQRPA